MVSSCWAFADSSSNEVNPHDAELLREPQLVGFRSGSGTRRTPREYGCRFANGTVVESGKPYEMAENHGRSFGVFFANCPIPLNETVDDTIEVMTTNVGASWSDVPIIYNALESIEESSYEHDLTVCLPFLYGNRYSGKEFVEFIELNRILGVQHFVAYVGETDIAKSLKKAASYYENLGILTLNRLEIPVSPSRIWYHGQLIAITDCLYRNIGVSRFVAFHDLDEFMIPQNLTSTEGLAPVIDALQELFLDNVASICLTTQYMIPRHKGELRTLYNTVAAQRVSTKLSKCVVRPEMVFEQGIHHTSRVIQNHFKSIHGDPNVLRLYHFKQTTDYHKEDTTVVVNYGERLTRRYKEVVKKIGL
ncbi:unnamed protein product [Nippostrongylus brasiliensis]|uniref:Glycosyltransferase family 92 protein n=1 Tax=Nippostrongylus brasiliensis TaxID=27835 RepID=A0A0N4YSV8_NIPBR|nr:unnamed protein product [Nippostrongylus brasiliensis]